jgi:hypothetical protein
LGSVVVVVVVVVVVLLVQETRPPIGLYPLHWLRALWAWHRLWQEFITCEYGALIA